ncbi:MAG TPA: hypothetical protein VGC77_01510 [Rhodopseudomonas sp.]|uniref:hypothetical protein n=1 Tax=Rhodopseudomonas sp. TaxID=1078 RepID=UPI002ED8F5DA
MRKITVDGKLDHLFVDDRDSGIEALDEKARVPSYGGNNLYRPSRALSDAESELANRIGTVAPADNS